MKSYIIAIDDVCHEKTDLMVLGRMGAVFWYDTDFSEFYSADIIESDYILEKSV